MPQVQLTEKDIKFVRALRSALKAQALAHEAAKEGPASNTIFLRPDPLLYAYFTER